VPAWQKLSARMSGTCLSKYDVQGPSGGGAVLRWKPTASIACETGPLAASLSQNYQKGDVDVPGNRAPPYINLTANFPGGYDVSYSDPRGRFVYVTAAYTF
jgi:iron complex outermembrane receptor protein